MELHDIQYNAQAKLADFERAFRKAELAGLAREPRTPRSWRPSWFARRASGRPALPQAGAQVSG